MKIEELFELLEPHKISVTWKGDIGVFQVGDLTYEAHVRGARPDEQQTYQTFFDVPVKVGNAEFSVMLPDGSRSQDLTGIAGRKAGQVFAGVANVVLAQKQKYGYSIMLLIAKRESSPTGYDERVNFYARLSSYAAKKFNLTNLDIKETPDYAVFALFNPNLLDGMIKVQQHMSNPL